MEMNTLPEGFAYITTRKIFGGHLVAIFKNTKDLDIKTISKVLNPTLFRGEQGIELFLHANSYWQKGRLDSPQWDNELVDGIPDFCPDFVAVNISKDILKTIMGVV